MTPRTLAWALVATMLFLAGCEPATQINQQNVSGAWTSNFNDAEVTLVFRADATFSMMLAPRAASQTEGGIGLMVLSGWSNYAMAEGWRLSDDEIVLSDHEDATVAGLPMIVKELSADRMVLQLGDKTPIEFTRTALPGATAPVPASSTTQPGVEDAAGNGYAESVPEERNEGERALEDE